jgi:hypothetical protein
MIVRGMELQTFLPIALTLIPLTPLAFYLIRSRIRGATTPGEAGFGRGM